MGFKKFSWLLGIRVLILVLTIVLFAYLLIIPGFIMATLLVLLLFIAQCFLLFQFVSKTNAELNRFLEAARYADFSQRFEFEGVGAEFDELGKTFAEIIGQFQTNRAGQEEKLRHLKAMIEHVPVPLISIHGDGRITLWNNSARRLFGSVHLASTDDLNQFNEEFSEQLQLISAGERRLVTLIIDGMEQQLTLSATQIVQSSNHEKLISLHNIQTELDMAQLQAWQDLVRVLTHEIMNSITPVASLSKTAADLLDDAKGKLTGQDEIIDELADVSDAVITVARRSEGLMKFVGSYRKLTRLPPPDKQLIRLNELFNQVSAIVGQNFQDKNINLQVSIQPSELEINVDIEMMEQLLINMLQNAEHAVSDSNEPTVKISAALNKRGHIIVNIEDNGAGVSDDIAKNIFVPFFTTKNEGSGVGLALSRQVMIAHGGRVKLEKSELGGALFRLTF